MVYKRKYEGKVTKSKIGGIPDNIFIYNDDINSIDVYEKLKDKIDWGYYVARAYERIWDFIGDGT